MVRYYLSKNNAYFYNMKTKQSRQPSKLTEAEKEALIMEAVAKLPKTSLFPEKVAWAKNLLKNAKFPPSFSK
jgi:hypothetical protein